MYEDFLFDGTINIILWKLFIDTTGDGNISRGKNSPEVLTHIDRQGKCFKYTLLSNHENIIRSIILILPFNYKVLLNTNLGSANMVDVGSKDTTRRMARAVAVVDIGEIAYKLVANNQVIVKEIRATSKLNYADHI